MVEPFWSKAVEIRPYPKERLARRQPDAVGRCPDRAQHAGGPSPRVPLRRKTTLSLSTGPAATTSSNCFGLIPRRTAETSRMRCANTSGSATTARLPIRCTRCFPSIGMHSHPPFVGTLSREGERDIPWLTGPHEMWKRRMVKRRSFHESPTPGNN